LRTPRDVSGANLAKALRTLDYHKVRLEGSRIRLTTHQDGEFHITVQNHQPIKVGTLKGILKCVAEHHKTTPEELLRDLAL